MTRQKRPQPAPHPQGTCSHVLEELFRSLGKDRNMRKEVMDLVHESGLDPTKLTLNELRSVAAAYLRKVILKMSHPTR